jgi:hypothetical protein
MFYFGCILAASLLHIFGVYFQTVPSTNGILHTFMGLVPCETMATYAEFIEFFKYSADIDQYISSKMEFKLCWKFTVGVEECATSIFRVVVGSGR